MEVSVSTAYHLSKKVLKFSIAIYLHHKRNMPTAINQDFLDFVKVNLIFERKERWIYI